MLDEIFKFIDFHLKSRKDKMLSTFLELRNYFLFANVVEDHHEEM